MVNIFTPMRQSLISRDQRVIFHEPILWGHDRESVIIIIIIHYYYFANGAKDWLKRKENTCAKGNKINCPTTKKPEEPTSEDSKNTTKQSVYDGMHIVSYILGRLRFVKISQR